MSPFTDSFLIVFLIIILIVATILDFWIKKIPNLLTFPSAIFALIYHSITNGFNGLLFSAGGLALGLGLLFIPYLLEGMGAGDTKLMGVVGGIIGPKAVFFAFLATAILGGVYALIVILIYRQKLRGIFKKQYSKLLFFLFTRKYFPDSVEGDEKQPQLYYGLAIALGTGVYIALDLSGYSFFI